MSLDGHEIKVPQSVASFAVTINNLLSDVPHDASDAIPLPYSAAALRWIFEYCEYHIANPHILARANLSLRHLHPAQQTDAANVSQCGSAHDHMRIMELRMNPELFAEVINAADYLDVPFLEMILSIAIVRLATDAVLHFSAPFAHRVDAMCEAIKVTRDMTSAELAAHEKQYKKYI